MAANPSRRRAAAGTRRGMPRTSKLAARRVEARPGGLTVAQEAVMVVMRVVGAPVLDEDLVKEYKRRRGGLRLMEQSESGIRSRRAELAKAEKLVQHGTAQMSTGGTGRTWAVAEREGDTA